MHTDSEEQDKLAAEFERTVDLVECATTTEGLVATVGPALRALANLIHWKPAPAAPDGLDGTSRLGADDEPPTTKTRSARNGRSGE